MQSRTIPITEGSTGKINGEKDQVKQQEGKSETFKKSIDVQFLIIT